MKADLMKIQKWDDMVVSYPRVWGELSVVMPDLTAKFTKRPEERFRLIPSSGKHGVTHRALRIQ